MLLLDVSGYVADRTGGFLQHGHPGLVLLPSCALLHPFLHPALQLRTPVWLRFGIEVTIGVAAHAKHFG